MNKPITFDEMSRLNAHRFQYQLYQYQASNSWEQAFYDRPIPVWELSSQYQPDTGILASYFHITFRNHIRRRRKQTQCHLIA